MAATESGALRKRGISLKKKILTAGFAALALFGGAAEAQAIDWHETESKSAYRGLWAFDCADADQVDVKVPAGAHNPEVVSPLPGQQLNGRDIDDMDLRGPVRVTDIANLGSSFRFTVQSVGDWCTVREDGYAWDYGWEVPAAEFSIRYQVAEADCDDSHSGAESDRGSALPSLLMVRRCQPRRVSLSDFRKSWPV